ncbi:uncharacterized protein LOC142979727 isoform X2 [Anticarsia gemmatalis]
MEQINSFRSGYNVGERNRNKLETQPVGSEDSTSNGANGNDTQTNNDNGINEEMITGEIIKCSKIPTRSRSSADTVIVDTCYETAADIQKDLESPPTVEGGEAKSLRDCITYSEPLTPGLQEVLDDFQSEPEPELESSDRESQLVIVENVPDTENPEVIIQDDSNKEQDNSDETTNGSNNTEEPTKAAENDKPDENKKQTAEASVNTSQIIDSEIVCLDDYPSDESEKIIEKPSNEVKKEVQTTKTNETSNADGTEADDSGNTDNIIVLHDTNSEPSQNSTIMQNTNNTDTSLPNNPEAFKKRLSNEKQAEMSEKSPEKKTENKVIRKRSSSEDTGEIVRKKKKPKVYKKKSETTTETEKPENISKTKSKKKEPQSNKPEEVEASDKKAEEKTAQVSSSLAAVLEKPSTSLANDVDNVLMTSDTDVSGTLNESGEMRNPCLQNVSLFDEQLKKNKYKSSDSDEQLKKTEVKDVPTTSNDVVILKSHTESETEDIPVPPRKRPRPGTVSSKLERERVLANVFGYPSGGHYMKRRKVLSRRRRTVSQTNLPNNAVVSDSSGWTSESESEVYVSPPRGRKNRLTKKYLKPRSGRIIALREEGGLFLFERKRILPVIKDGRVLKHYLTYHPDSESEDENYWKLKYIEEKKKVDDYKKLLEKVNPSKSSRTSTAIAAPESMRNSTSSHNQAQETAMETDRDMLCLPGPEEKTEETKPKPPESIKIKFTTRNDQEIQLEGNWPQIHNVLEHVVQIFHKEPAPVSAPRRDTVVEPPSSSGLSTPLAISAVPDPDTHEKVNEIEDEIFKEIEERDKEEHAPTKQSKENGQEINVTKRKPGRPRKSSQSSSPRSPAKRQKTSKEPEKIEAEENSTDNKPAKDNSTDNKATTNNGIDNEAAIDNDTDNKTAIDNKVATDKTPEVDNDDTASTTSSKRQVRQPRKLQNESNTKETKQVQTRRSKSKAEKTDLNTSVGKEDDKARYMFPPKVTRQSLKLTTDKKTRDKPHKSTVKALRVSSPPDNVCLNSTESTQGYQDSDVSPMKTELRRKKWMNPIVMKSKAKSHLRRSISRKSHPYLYCDESSNSSSEVPVRKVARDNSTLNTEVYRSDSYQLLMPQVKTSRKRLESINETSPLGHEVDYMTHLDSTNKNEVFSIEMTGDFTSHNSGQLNSDFGSSSNMSLPISPELSVVENLSLSKDMLEGIDEGPTINEMQNNDPIVPTSCDQYMISAIDVSVPLMQQECGLESCHMASYEDSLDPKGIVTESLLSKIGTFNIDDKTNLTDTLDIKLKELLLESAKKIAAQNKQNKENLMDVDETNVEVVKKAKNKKRCSTPRKRKDSQKSKKPKVQTVIEEEHIETCSQGGRKSCPPIIQAVAIENDIEHAITKEIEFSNLTIDENAKPKGRKKKDVIKVKILKPKTKKSLGNITKSAPESSKTSICNDSGINDTSGVYPAVDESVDLIHNHSETCLHANECVGDSIEFVENSMRSVLTLGDSMQSGDNEWLSLCEFNDGGRVSPDCFCNNAQDVRSFYKSKQDDVQHTCYTDIKSPVDTEASSLMTEDLSDELPLPHDQPNKWYLLSEDETTNTNMAIAQDPPINVASFGANLKQLFPIACAVPDLSTITEMSRENDDNSRKPTLEGLTSDGFNSQSIFDSNL